MPFLNPQKEEERIFNRRFLNTHALKRKPNNTDKHFKKIAYSSLGTAQTLIPAIFLLMKSEMSLEAGLSPTSGVCIRKIELKLEPKKTAHAFVECSFRMGILSAHRDAETRGKVE